MNGEHRTDRRYAGSLTIILLAAWIAGCSSTSPQPAAGADVPFRLTLERMTIRDRSGQELPGLHSVAHVVYGSKLVIVGGRTNGMHLFTQQRRAGLIWSFPPAMANDRVYVVDLKTLTLDGSAPVTALPSAIALQLQATNAQSFSKDGWFYVVGGYGVTEDGKSMRTFDQVVAIELKALIDAVRTGRKLDVDFARQHIHVGDHPALAVTGGGVTQLGGKTLLVFGQMFNGLYTTDGSVAQQEYSQAVRVVELKLSDKAVDGIRGIDVTYAGKCPDPPATEEQPLPDGPYHRRDFTLARVLSPNGVPRIAVYGGVFKGGRMEGYVNPVYLTPGANANCAIGGFALGEDTGSSQWLGQYDGAVIPIYNRDSGGRTGAIFTTFFGGISQYYWDGSSLRRDPQDFSKDPPVDGLPFINSISTLRVTADRSDDFLHVNERFPPVRQEPRCGGLGPAPYLGTNSFFVMADGMESGPAVDNGVFLLDRLPSTQPTVIGYIFGGIASTLPYPGKATCASNVVYRVTLDRRLPTRTVKLEPPRP